MDFWTLPLSQATSPLIRWNADGFHRPLSWPGVQCCGSKNWIDELHDLSRDGRNRERCLGNEWSSRWLNQMRSISWWKNVVFRHQCCATSYCGSETTMTNLCVLLWNTTMTLQLLSIVTTAEIRFIDTSVENWQNEVPRNIWSFLQLELWHLYSHATDWNPMGASFDFWCLYSYPLTV